MNKRDQETLDVIKAEASRVQRHVQYLREFPQDVKSRPERLQVQRQQLLDIIDRLEAEEIKLHGQLYELRR